jgi:glutathione transport system permease protein
VAVLVFLFVHMLPGDPARLAAGQDADEQTVAMVRRSSASTSRCRSSS